MTVDDVAVIVRGWLALHASLEDLRERVRQVELPAGTPLPELGPHASVLGRTEAEGTRIFWVRCSDSDDAELRRLLGPGATIRPTGLEMLYMAVTRHRETATSGAGRGRER